MYRFPGSSTTWTQSAAANDDETVFEKYLRFVFAYASTISLSDESKKIKKAEIQAGDIFVQGGSPGHAVMVLDVCMGGQRDGKHFCLDRDLGRRAFLVLKNPLHEDDPW